MTDVAFEVGEQGQPALIGEEAAAPPPEDVQTETLVALPSWTPEEAARKAAEILTTGILIGYVARHQRIPAMAVMQRLVFHPAEFPSTGTAMVPFLNRFVPKGGIADVGISASAMLGEIGLAIGKRWQAFNESPPQQPEMGPGAPPPPPQAPEPAGPAPAPEGSSAGYRLPRDVVEVMKPRPNDALTGIGL